MIYFLDGAAIEGASLAREMLMSIAENAGHCAWDIEPIWDARYQSEEARELISELSDYRLELRLCE